MNKSNLCKTYSKTSPVIESYPANLPLPNQHLTSEFQNHLNVVSARNVKNQTQKRDEIFSPGPAHTRHASQRYTDHSDYSRKSNMSTTSRISAVSNLIPFAKNRTRAYSTSGVSLEEDVSIQMSRTVLSELKEAIRPWDQEEFNEGGVVMKILSVIIAPPFLLCKWTCPVVRYNELNQCWNKIVAILQGACIPFLLYFMFKQYEAKPFGYEEGSG